jgi:hypothetical protein
VPVREFSNDMEAHTCDGALEKTIIDMHCKSKGVRG